MPVPTDINSLSTTPSANSPIGSTDSPSVLDDHQRQAYAHIATLRDSLSTGLAAKAPIASPTFTGTVGGVTGAMVANTPAGDIAATTVQAAINELDTEKVPLNGTGATGTWGISISGNAATASNGGVTSVNGGTGAVVIQGVPTGAVSYFAMSSAPTGWLKANGALVSRTTYSALFSAIGTVFGAGDGSTTFQLPDLRGEFLRGVDDGRGVDPGRVVGVSQKGSLLVGDSSVNIAQARMVGTEKPLLGWDVASMGDYPVPYLSVVAASSGVAPSGSYVGVARPRNIALLACIKY